MLHLAEMPVERNRSRIVVRFKPEVFLSPEQSLVMKLTKRK